jgi:metal-sulfur cluster biosynthetic enzyme
LTRIGFFSILFLLNPWVIYGLSHAQEADLTVEEAHKALGTVFDPELGYSVTELGMIYGINIEGDKVSVEYSLTSFGCPLAEILEGDIRRALQAADPKAIVLPKLVWSPPWGPERMSEEIRLEFGYPL